MASRSEYNSCMRPWMSGKGLSKEERRQKMCVGAKLCTGKAQNETEAAQICSMPKATKAPKAAPRVAAPAPAIQRQSLRSSVQEPADCNVGNFFMAASAQNKLYAYITAAECQACEELDDKIAKATITTPFVKIPADQCPEIADQLGVEVFPSVVLLRKGEVKKIHTGRPDKIVEKMRAGR